MNRLLKKYSYIAILKVRGLNYGSEYLKIKNIYDEEKLFNLKEKYIKNLLLHAYKNVPYYHRIFKEIGLVNDEIVDFSKFFKIPLLTKEKIRNEEILSKDYTTRKIYHTSTGGSTGEPIKFLQDNNYRKWKNATNKYYYQDILDIDEVKSKKIILWGSERDLFTGSIGLKTKMNIWSTNTKFLNSYRMTEENMESYIKIINSYKPDLIRGYTGPLYALCRYAEKKNTPIISPKILICSAETLTDEMRQKIETVFGTKLYNFYGSREVASIAGECKYGLMHIFLFNNYVEILDNRNRPVKSGIEGRVIVTNLHNYSMPFIRYEIGDMAILGPARCKCGSLLPTLKNVTGRITDHFLKEDGTVIPAEFFISFFGVFWNKGLINKFQVIQEDYKKIRILVVPAGNIDRSEKKFIEDKIKIVMGEDCDIVWDFVDNIPKTKSGKYIYTKSLVWK